MPPPLAGGLNYNITDLMTYLEAKIGAPASPLEQARRDAHRGDHLTRPGVHVGLGWMTMKREPLNLVGLGGGTARHSSYLAFDAETGAGGAGAREQRRL